MDADGSVDLRGQTLINVDRDYTMRMDTREGWHIAIEDEGVVDDKDLAAALYGAIDQAITSFAIADDGVLSFTVGDAEVRVPPDPQYEAWNIVGPLPGKPQVVCLPGGELAIWD